MVAVTRVRRKPTTWAVLDASPASASAMSEIPWPLVAGHLVTRASFLAVPLPALVASIIRARATPEPSVHLVSLGAHLTVSVDTAEVPLAVRSTASLRVGEITQSVNVAVFWTLRSEGP
jgi:hypothetical protein